MSGWEFQERQSSVPFPKGLCRSESSLVQSWCHLVADCYKCSIACCEDLRGQGQKRKERFKEARSQMGNLMSSSPQTRVPQVQHGTGPIHDTLLTSAAVAFSGGWVSLPDLLCLVDVVP